MNFDQGELDFTAKGTENGFHRWRQRLQEQQRAFERRWGVPLGSRVWVTLQHLAKPVKGRIEWVSHNGKTDGGVPRFRIGGLEFSVDEIESLVRQD